MADKPAPSVFKPGRDDDNKDAPAPAPTSPVGKLAQVGPETLVTYPSTGPKYNDHGMIIHNGHSILYDVAGKEVWLHADYATFAGDKVTLPIWHAKDMHLSVPE